MAESANSFDINYDAETSTVTIDVTVPEGFLVALLRLDVKGFDIERNPEDPKELMISVTDEISANPDCSVDLSAKYYNFENGVLSLLLDPVDNMSLDLVAYAKITIPVTKTAAEGEEYSITLTTIQAADAGSVVGDQIQAEKFIDFPFVENDEDGAIDLEAAADKAVAVDKIQHECKVVTYTDNGDGTHDGICDCEAATVVVDNEAHADEDANNACDKCEATLVVPCKHENMTSVVTVEATKDAEGVRTYTCECGHTETAPIAKPVLYTTVNASAKGVGGSLYITEKFKYRLGTYTSETNKFDSYKLVIETKYYEGNDYVLSDDVKILTAADRDEGTETRDYYDVFAAAYATGFDIYATVYYYDADGNTLYYITKTYNIASKMKSYVTEELAKASPDLNKVKFYMDTLNYCAAAQTHFRTDTNGLKDAVLVNADMTEYQNYASQDTPDYSSLAVNNKIKENDAIAKIGKTIIVGESNYIRYNITLPSGSTGEDLQLKVTYSSSYANQDPNYQPIVKIVNVSDLPVEGARPYYLFTDVALYDSHIAVKVEILQNGVSVVEHDYNIASYIAGRIGNPSAADLQGILTALVKFAASSRVFFGYDI